MIFLCGCTVTAVDAEDAGVEETRTVEADEAGVATPATPVEVLRPAGCPVGECDLVDSNCAEGSGCQMLPIGEDGYGPMCQPAGDGAEDARCESYLDCAPGLTCMPLSGSDEFRCRRYCCGDNAPCGPGRLCSLFLQSPAGELTNAALCMPASECNPISSEGCEAGRGCYLSVNFMGRLEGDTQCLPSEGHLPAGSPCERGNDCIPGNQCLNQVCQRFCSTLGEQSCGPLAECLPLGVSRRPTLGYCLVTQ